MRLLFTTSSPSLDLAWPVLADEQMVCGPLHLDLDLGGQVFSRRTPAGDYDLAAMVEALPADQRPDMIACVVDGRTESWPRNLAAFPGPRLLLIGDSQNTAEGLSRLLAYAEKEPFDRIIFTHGCLDEPLFVAAGLKNIFWFPGLLCPVHDAWLPIIRQAEREAKLLSAPAGFARHSALNLQLEALDRAKIAFSPWSDHAETRLEQLGHNLIGLVPSERGEWAPEFFEVLAAGGFLVTGGLGARAGLERLWPEGAPFAVVDDPDTACLRVATWLDMPAAVSAQRAAAAEWYDRFLGAVPRRAAFIALVREGRPAVAPARPKDSPWMDCDPAALKSVLPAATALHSVLGAHGRPAAWLSAETPPAWAALCGRFPRMQLSRDANPGDRVWDLAIAQTPESAGRATHIWAVQPEPAKPGHEAFGAIPGFTVEKNFRAAAEARDGAWKAMEEAHHARAFEFAKREITARPDSLDGHLVLAELFAVTGSSAGFEKHRDIVQRLNRHDPRLMALLRRFAPGSTQVAQREAQYGWELYATATPEAALAFVEPRVAKTPRCLSLQALHAHLLTVTGKREAAADAWFRAARYHPNEDELWFNLGHALWRIGRRLEAGFALRRAADHAPQVEAYRRAFARALAEEPSIPVYAGPERNLIVTSSEVCHKHGVGVLIKRFFSSHLDTITLRPSSPYEGTEEVGGTHLCVPFEELSVAELQTRLRRLLAPYAIRRIMCVPFRREESIYAIAAQEVTGAALCTYVMDDRNVLLPDTDDRLLQDLFQRSSLRLAISSELQMAYTIKYDFDFDVMPPIVVNRDARRANRWTPKLRPPSHAALVGNIWTEGQLQQLLRFIARCGLTVDWYGNQQPRAEFSAAAINLMGFVPESILADKLTEYPFVLMPSGMLDGSEDNEWLTRLSLPSRIVFLLQTQTPVLVLGSADTCAGRYVVNLGIGRVMPYNHPSPAQMVREMTAPEARAVFLEQAARAADGFVMPNAGSWIWSSLDAGHALPAPFHQFMERVPAFEVVWPDSDAGPLPISHLDLVSAAKS